MSTKYKVPAIVLGMTVNGLGVVRSLARHGIKVYALDSYATRPGMSTRYAKCVVCPDVQKSAGDFKNFLLDFTKQIGGEAVLLPTSDAHSEFVNLYRDELSPNLKFAMTPKAAMDLILDKKGQYALAQKCNVPIPGTYFPENLEDISDLSDKLAYPVILKGLSTGKWRKKFGDKKAVIVKNAAELLNAYKEIHDLDKITPIIQEIILGDDTRHYKICAYMDRHSNPLLTFTLQKIRQYPCDFGIGSSVRSVWVPEVADLGLKFMKEVGYWGVGSIEFKKDLRDEKFKMIEMNPRLWAQNSLPDACGQNFALTAYLDILGEKVEPKTKFEEGIKWISFEEDRTSFKGYHAQGRMSWGHWLKSILTGKRVWGTWVWDDPLPFLKVTKFGFLPFVKVYSKINEKLQQRHSDRSPQGEARNLKSVIANPEGVKQSLTNLTDNNSINLEIIKDFKIFLDLRGEWNELLEKSGINNPFLRHEWLSAWWKGYGADKELFVIVFKKEGRTIGAIPLMKYKTELTRIPIEAIGFISNHWTRMDFILAEDHELCLDKFSDFLSKQKKIFILAQLDTESKNFSFFQSLLHKKNILFSETKKQAAYIDLNGNWDEYLKNQSRNFRMDFNKKLRRLEKVGPVGLNQNSNGAGHIIQQLQKVAQNSWQANDRVNIVSQEQGQAFYFEILKEWANKNILDFSFFEVDNKPVSYMVGLKNNGTYFAFDTAYSKDFQQYSPGMLMHNLLLERLFGDGLNRFDFGSIAEYKKRWTEQISGITDVIILPKNIQGATLLLAIKIKNFVRKYKFSK